MQVGDRQSLLRATLGTLQTQKGNRDRKEDREQREKKKKMALIKRADGSHVYSNRARGGASAGHARRTQEGSTKAGR